MKSHNVLARLAGAQPDVLRSARTEKVKYTAMGGVLLTTAGVAGVSAGFALNTAVGLSVAAAVVTGALWALVIFNLDRMLVVSMTRQSGWVRNVFTAVPRVALAVVIGAIISVPLVLRIFQPEIDAELPRLHSDNLIAAQQKLDQEFADIAPLQKQVDDLQAVASGQAQPAVDADPDVQAAQKQVDEAQAAYDKAAQAAQCELDGSCGTGQRGGGEAYRGAKARADQAETALNTAKAKLDAATAAANTRISGSAASNRDAATQQLAVLAPQLEQRKQARADRQATLGTSEDRSEGLLARLEALDRLSADNATMRSANWALFLLFLLIEVLPVLVKLLAMVGRETLYDRLLRSEEDTLEQRATMTSNNILELEKHRAAEQLTAGQQANTLLVAKQSEIAKKAIDIWGRIATSRSDAEIARWYAQHAGQQATPAPSSAAPAQTTPAPTGHPANPAPTGQPAAPTPAGQTASPQPTAPPAPPIPDQRGVQSYQQFKAQYAGQSANGNGNSNSGGSGAGGGGQTPSN
jgi:Domain of unknown function (DUF4407)